MSKHEFDPTAIAGLLSQAQENSENIMPHNPNLPTNREQQPLNQGPEVDVGQVYSQLSDLINTGNTILEAANYLVQSAPDPENISSTASLLSSVKDVLKEFRLIHQDKLRRDHDIKMEQIKQEGKKELVELKAQKMRELNQKEPKNITDESTEMIGYTQEQIIDRLSEQEEQRRKEIVDAEIIEDSTPENQ